MILNDLVIKRQYSRVMAALSLDQKFSTGSVVWGKLGSYKLWPSIIVNSTDIGLPNAKFGSVWVFWFGDYKVSQLSRKKIFSFTSNFNHMHSKDGGKCHQTAINEALEVLATRFNHRHKCTADLLLWAKKGFKTFGKALIRNNDLPPLVIKHLNRIQNINKKFTECKKSTDDKKSTDAKKSTDDKKSTNAKKSTNDKKSTDDKKSTEDCSMSTSVTMKTVTSYSKFEQVKEGFVKIQDVCVACFGDDADVVAHHPLFEGGLCLECKERLIETIFAFGNDGKNVCCVICAKPGSLILCDNISCPRSYCCDCIDLLLGEEAQQQIIETTPWLCFFCQKQSNNEHSLLQIEFDWEKRLHSLFQPSKDIVDEISMLCQQTKRPIRVLSLFDGISTGKVALDSLGIAIDKYYASEIDEDAINVSKLHHWNSIIHIGDVANLTEPKIQSICPIDLLIGGSPCNELSLVNPNRKGIYDFTGTGPLFFDYYRVLKTIEIINGKRPLLFLFENVASMRLKDKSVITAFLMREPVLVDAKSVSPQSRPRYFWGNIPGMSSYHDFCAESHGDSSNDDGYESDKLLGSFLLEGFERKAMVEKIRTVTTRKNSLIQNDFNLMPVEMNGKPDTLWITELEKIFGLPQHYTDTGYLGINRRRELLGKSWSVPVIRNILRPVLNFFKTNDDVQ